MTKETKSPIVGIVSREETLKRNIRRHLEAFGFSKSGGRMIRSEYSNKDYIRTLHATQRNEKINSNMKFIVKNSPKLVKHFACGKDVVPGRIFPVLERVCAETWQSDLFRFASLTWSVPVSNGFGRRLRYLVWDGHNKKLIGSIAIGDPVFNLSVRDNLIGWDSREVPAL